MAPGTKGTPIGSEENPLGVQTASNTSTVAQLTFHIDHAFWESFQHDSPPHFDSYAAKVAGATGTPTVTLEDYRGYSFTPFVDAANRQVPWRQCVDAATYQPLPGNAMTFDTQGVSVNPTGDPATAIRDYYDYVTYNHSTFGHLNADGLAAVDRQYPSPP